MTELTFSAGQRATLDLRDSAGTVAIKDWDEPTIRIATEGESSPFVLRETDTFRIRLNEGGTITLPTGLPVEVLVPRAVQLRLMRVTRAGGETIVRPADSGASGAGDAHGAPDAAGGRAGAPPDLTEFARQMSEQGRRIFDELTRAVRASGVGVSEDAARRLEEAAERIDKQVRHVAERVQQEVNRTYEFKDRAQHHAQRAAVRAEEHARRAAERAERLGERHAQRHAERTERHVHREVRIPRRGRWWFAERFENEPSGGRGPAAGQGSSTGVRSEERLAILKMLQEGKITSDQASKLLAALGA